MQMMGTKCQYSVVTANVQNVNPQLQRKPSVILETPSQLSQSDPEARCLR